MCLISIPEQTFLYTINGLVCITQTECIYCAVRAESLNVGRIQINLCLEMFTVNWDWGIIMWGEVGRRAGSVLIFAVYFIRGSWPISVERPSRVSTVKLVQFTGSNAYRRNITQIKFAIGRSLADMSARTSQSQLRSTHNRADLYQLWASEAIRKGTVNRWTARVRITCVCVTYYVPRGTLCMTHTDTSWRHETICLCHTEDCQCELLSTQWFQISERVFCWKVPRFRLFVLLVRATCAWALGEWYWQGRPCHCSSKAGEHSWLMVRVCI
jgi:hypothetical protein